MNKKSKPQTKNKIYPRQIRKMSLDDQIYRFDKRLSVHREKIRQQIIKKAARDPEIRKELENIKHHHKQEQKLNKSHINNLIKKLKKEISESHQRHDILTNNLSNFKKSYHKSIKAKYSDWFVKERPDDDHAEMILRIEGHVEKDFYSEINIENFNTTILAKAGLQQITAYKRSKLFIIRELVYEYTPKDAVLLTLTPYIKANGHYWENTIDTCFEDNVAEVGATVRIGCIPKK